MKPRKPRKLTKTDEKAAQMLSQLGMPKNFAKTLLYLSHVDECYSADIEHGADLRQPEVSIAMRELRRRKWVDKRVLKHEGKGRPRNIYKMTTDLSEVLEDFEREKLKEAESIKSGISELKDLIENR